jgi:hypothetical protein
MMKAFRLSGTLERDLRGWLRRSIQKKLE